MAKRGKPKVKRGRPVKPVKAVIVRLVLSLDPIKDADLIKQFSQATERGKSALAVSLMRSGIPKSEPEEDKVSPVVFVDDSEF